jgi:hypothetical protein
MNGYLAYFSVCNTALTQTEESDEFKALQGLKIPRKYFFSQDVEEDVGDYPLSQIWRYNARKTEYDDHILTTEQHNPHTWTAPNTSNLIKAPSGKPSNITITDSSTVFSGNSSISYSPTFRFGNLNFSLSLFVSVDSFNSRQTIYHSGIPKPPDAYPQSFDLLIPTQNNTLEKTGPLESTMEIYANTGGSITFLLTNPANDRTVPDATITQSGLATNTFHHLVLTRENKTFKFYVNKTLAGSLSFNGSFYFGNFPELALITTSEIHLGSRSSLSSTLYPLTGKIKYMGVCDEAITQEEVNAEYDKVQTFL